MYKRKIGEEEKDKRAVSGSSTQTIAIGQQQLVPGTTSTYSLKLNNFVNFGTNSWVCLSAGQQFFSWNNLSLAQYNNVSYNIVWIDGTVLNVVMPDGQAGIDSISGYIQFIMQQQKWYLTDSNNNIVNYLTLQTNDYYNRVQINATALPSSLPAGWSYPPGVTWTTTAKTPQLVVLPPPQNFYTIIGFNPGTYPANTTYTTGTMSQTASTTLVGVGTTFTALMVGGSAHFSDGTSSIITAFTDATHLTLADNQTQPSQTTNITYNATTTTQAILGNFAPQVSPVTSVVINCNLVSNPNTVTNPQQIWTFSGNGLTPRSSVNYQINEYLWLPIVVTQTNTVTIFLTDQNGKELIQDDTNVNFSLYLDTPNL